MGIIATLDFTGRSFSIVAGAWVATRSWTVTGTNDELEACDAAASHGDAHPDNDNMHVWNRTPVPKKGPFSWTVTAQYKFGDVGAGAANPCDEPVQVLPDIEFESDAYEYDRDGNPVVNSGSDPYDPPETNFTPIITFVIRKFVPFFDLSTAASVTHKVNNDSLTIGSWGTADEGQVYCYYYRPVSGYTNLAPYVQIETKIGVKTTDAFGNVLTDPWQKRVVDQGRWGYFTGTDGNTYRGRLCNFGGSPVDFDVRLDGTGKPILTGDQGFLCIPGDDNPHATAGAATPCVPNPNLPAGLSVDPVLSNANIKVLIWKNVPEADFSSLV